MSLTRNLRRSIINLPPITRRVCKTQMFNWFACSVFHYLNLYLSQSYTKSYPHVGKDLAEAQGLARILSARVLLVSQCAGLLIVVLISHLWQPERTPLTGDTRSKMARLRRELHLDTTELKRPWRASFGVLALLLLSAFLMQDFFDIASILTCGFGVVSTMNIWIPHTMIAQEISTIRVEHVLSMELGRTPGDSAGKEREQTGTILAIHNIALMAPQKIWYFWGCHFSNT
ncbi:uncharacterized protein BCR38DRAFT_142195 [Pseudomassariella vexata]|uniref:Uncharacterized protein n=1 Tax=Pseudomassariella vexata TaxID=1141098 RepID=A0A1Y2EBR4_9PEZI|nr:uncharacterized protein BCR38DRAFT_142195 [Pseudomassariella vexata]ORY68982.1 hypothetical protein BCR38DRAFT_142195 [Pseudomassariella vexata]